MISGVTRAADIRPTKFDAVLFDCDGVLVDSEAITIGVLRDMLAELGWEMSLADCMRLFIGKAVKDEVATIESRTGRRLSEGWLEQFRDRRNEGLRRNVKPITGAIEGVKRIHAAYDGRIACASGADRHKVELQLEKCGLMQFFAGRIFSGYEMAKSKPAPDVYLAAARALGVDAGDCAVVEDTTTGVCAGVSAGATVFGFCPDELAHGESSVLLAAGAKRTFACWSEIADVLCGNDLSRR